MIDITQQDNAVSAGCRSPGHFHDQVHDLAANTFVVVRFRWRIGFGNQDVAVG